MGLAENSKNTSSTCQYCGQPSGISRYCCNACEKLDLGLQNLKEQMNAAVAARENKYSYLDQAEIQNLYTQNELINEPTKDVLFFIEGLQCSSCVHLLEKIPEYNSDCISARVQFGSSTLLLKIKPNSSLSKLALLIEELGYKPQPIKKSDNTEKQILFNNRSDLKRIAVAGFCAGNIMIFSFSLYAGATGTMAEVFRWLSFIVFLPLLFYSAVPFYKGAWNALKFKTIHIDLPIAVALITSVIFSTYNLIIGSNEFYFDSTAGFLFLILVARFLVKRTQQHYLSPARLSNFIKDQPYEKQDGTFTLPEFIQKNDVLKIQCGQTIPVDAELISNEALIDTSFFNGESIPHIYSKDLILFAGYKVLSKEITVRAQTEFRTSRLSELFQDTLQNILSKSHYLNLSDRLAEKLLITVFSISAVFFVVYGSLFNYHDAFNRVLALIVVACPCALAFGSPITLAMAFKKAQANGIALRNADVLEKMNEIQNVFFDKTGTLTEGQLEVTQIWPENLDQNDIDLILNLEKISYHPIAFALRNYWGHAQQQISFDVHEEVLGLGIRAEIKKHQLGLESDRYEVKALPANMHEDDLAIVVMKNREPIARIYFSDHIRSESKAMIEKLQKYHIQTYLLSGDKKSKALSIGTQCGIPKQNIYAELYPEDKENIIKNYPFSVMVGDGVNDTLAISHSHVGIAVKGSAQLTLSSADVLFLKGGLTPLFDLLALSVVTKRTLQRNLFLALLYNSFAGFFALAGWINPFWAAILMPISTGLVVLSSLWGFHK